MRREVAQTRRDPRSSYEERTTRDRRRDYETTGQQGQSPPRKAPACQKGQGREVRGQTRQSLAV